MHSGLAKTVKKYSKKGSVMAPPIVLIIRTKPTVIMAVVREWSPSLAMLKTFTKQRDNITIVIIITPMVRC